VLNLQEVPITVNSLSISAVSAPAGCAISNLDDSHTSFSGSLVVPAGGSGAVSVPISLYDTSANQDACEGTTFDFSYAGSATYTEVYGTATLVNSPADPSSAGDSVTYSATTTASATASQDPVPSSPTGTITFLDGASVICAAVPVTSGTVETAIASCTPPTYTGVATHEISAVYTNSDGNFVDSTSSTFSQAVTP